jgi:hypothetical protein
LKKLIIKALNDESIRSKEVESERIRAKLNSIRKERSKYLELYGQDLFTREELDQKIISLNKQKLHLEHNLIEIEDFLQFKNGNILQNISSIVQTLYEFPYWTAIQKREYLRSQIPEFIIKKEQGISSVTINLCKVGNHMGTGS